MKKFLAIALMLALVVVSCKKPEPEVKDSISLNTTSWTAPYEGESLTLTVTASGDFKGEPDVAWITVSGAKVTVAENTAYESRSGKVTFTCGTASAVLTVNQDAAPKPKEYTELPGPANSFIVSEAGDYKIKATVMGNGDAGLHPSFPIKSTAINPEGAKLVWQEVEGLITDVKLQDGYICFNCANKDGNALLAATAADGTILWSWHIWSAEAPKDVACNEKWTLMDRNLGATMATGEESYGLYYQWGRKDPFSSIIAFDSGAGEGWYHPCVGNEADQDNPEIHSIEYSIAHPNEYIGATTNNANWLLETGQGWLWGHYTEEAEAGLWHDFPVLKTIFDPCPKGYAVPTLVPIFNGWTGEDSIDETQKTATLFGGKIVLPPAGFVYNAGYGWYDFGGFPGIWEGSTPTTGWGGNTEMACRFRGLVGAVDPTDHYERATGHPIRCVKFAE